MLCAIAANLAYHAGHPGAVPWSVLPIGTYNFGMALATLGEAANPFIQGVDVSYSDLGDVRLANC